jgi:hypothetical protein
MSAGFPMKKTFRKPSPVSSIFVAAAVTLSAEVKVPTIA